jgi:hypothetical protein
VLEFLDNGFGDAGDDQAGANGGLIAAFGRWLPADLLQIAAICRCYVEN